MNDNRQLSAKLISSVRDGKLDRLTDEEIIEIQQIIMEKPDVQTTTDDQDRSTRS